MEAYTSTLGLLTHLLMLLYDVSHLKIGSGFVLSKY